MLQHKAETFWRLSGHIGQMIVHLQRGIMDAEYLGETLGEVHRELIALDLPMSVKKSEAMTAMFVRGCTHIEFQQAVSDLNERVHDELESRVFLSLDNTEAKFYAPKGPPFGAEVERAFPALSEDIESAGRCIAVGQSTAAVFHLMRAMEVAVGALAAKLGIGNIEREWGKLLSDIDGKITNMPKGNERDAWSEARANLYHVKQAWRNPTMHPKQTYTPEQAREIFAATKVFMAHLADLV